MISEDLLAAYDIQRKPDETDAQLRARVKRVMGRGNRGGSVHDIAAGLIDATPNAINAGYKDATTRYEPSWWRRWFLREKPRVELRAYFVVVVQRTGSRERTAQLIATDTLRQVCPAGVLGRVEVLEQAGAL